LDKAQVKKPPSDRDYSEKELEEAASAKEPGLEYQLFYNSNPVLNKEVSNLLRSEMGKLTAIRPQKTQRGN
jgi:hypothetical protein